MDERGVKSFESNTP